MISKNRMKWVRGLEMRKHREAEGVFVAEGTKVVGDLLGAFPCRYVAATEEWLAEHGERLQRMAHGAEVDVVTEEELRRTSLLEAPQGVLAVMEQRRGVPDVGTVASEDLCLALDGVQNPGNVGTIVRVADWFGIGHVLLGRGCADVYNPKTVQATMGALARVEVHGVDLPEVLKELPEGMPVCGTFLDGENLYGKRLPGHGVIVMGSEGRGVSAEVERLVTERLWIPNYPAGRVTSESLNVAVAAAVVCAEFRRR